jgi:hypothetical protein
MAFARQGVAWIAWVNALVHANTNKPTLRGEQAHLQIAVLATFFGASVHLR